MYLKTELNTLAYWGNYIIKIILMIKTNLIKIGRQYLLQYYWKLVVKKKSTESIKKRLLRNF